MFFPTGCCSFFNIYILHIVYRLNIRHLSDVLRFFVVERHRHTGLGLRGLQLVSRFFCNPFFVGTSSKGRIWFHLCTWFWLMSQWEHIKLMSLGWPEGQKVQQEGLDKLTNTYLLSYVIHPPLQFRRLMLVDLLLPKLIYCLVESAEHILVGTWISVICLDSFCWMSKTQDHVLRVCTEGKKGLRKAWGRWDWDFQTGWLVVCSWWSCIILYQCNRLVGRCLYGHWGMSDLWINVNGSVTRASPMEVVKLLKWR